ncbi:hypothetical protein NQ317_018545 [Molorchus minor]|uniref:Uncharacterized protein n=1 Tax=Molorchus minor TaxID=1323400 RepID=A0ABQ9JZ36_9CUCU|nr:hypothetical protein NQ317_018545 [Molorchus minor]
MKLFVFVAAIFAIFGFLNAAPRTDEDVADKVQKVIDEILTVLPESLAIKGDVINIPENDLENGQITIGEISITGVKALDTKLNYDADTSRLDYTLNWGDIAFVMDVTTELSGLISIDHHLTVKMEIKDLKNEGYATVSTEDKEVTDLDLLVSIGEANFDVQGLLNDDELSQKVTDFLNENVAKVINTVNPLIAPYFSQLVKDVINVALKMEN